MKNYTCFNYDFLFGDHFAKISNQAKLYYIKLNFHANNGFVPNPMSILDSLGYDKGVFNELIKNGELLQLPDRCEVFIASYYVHNKGLKPFSWKSTPYAVYWENKLYVKKNGIVDFAPEGFPQKEEKDPLDKIITPDYPDEYNEEPLNAKILREKNGLDATEKMSNHNNELIEHSINPEDYDEEPDSGHVDIVDYLNKQ